MDELLAILEDQATLTHWEFVLRHSGLEAANQWLQSFWPGGVSETAIGLLEQWYGGSQAAGSVMNTGGNINPGDSVIPIDPRIGQGYRYEVTAEIQPHAGGPPEFRTIFIDNATPLTVADIMADDSTLIFATLLTNYAPSSQFNPAAYDVTYINVVAVWRGQQ